MTPEALRNALCSVFCDGLSVREVPAGLAVSTPLEGSAGDRLDCLIERFGAGWRISDDGSFLADLEAYGVEIRRGGRAEFLARTLGAADAHVDDKTLQVIAELDAPPSPSQVLSFLSALSKAHDVTFWTKERLRSTFKEDATAALLAMLGNTATIQTNAAVDQSLAEFPCDLIIRPLRSLPGNAVTAVYLAQAVETLNEAMALAQELKIKDRRDIRVTAIVDEGVRIDSPKAKRAMNRISATAFFQRLDRVSVRNVARTAIVELE